MTMTEVFFPNADDDYQKKQFGGWLLLRPVGRASRHVA
jgi:hypothetical protein